MSIDKKLSALALWLLVPLPTVGTLAAMMWPATRGTVLGQGLYFFSKVWILLVPLWWLMRVERRKPGWPPLRRDGLGFGFASGLVVGVSIWLVYVWIGKDWIDAATVAEQARANGIGTPIRFLALAGYLCFVNALLEEYVWRWFVFRRCETLWGSKAGVVTAGLFFTLHHVFALAAQFDARITLLGSLGVFTGGLLWSWCYARYRSVWPGYVSHVLVDIAIMIIGWQLIFGAGA
ncbi:MAG: CPBP family intramembrane metalloprotease [Acidobacteriota bacterium]|nr:CPBP family intramembrane metalloprotease [Acidobacteriota bacterium]